jgi:hypothetical protein
LVHLEKKQEKERVSGLGDLWIQITRIMGIGVRSSTSAKKNHYTFSLSGSIDYDSRATDESCSDRASEVKFELDLATNGKMY